ncbi:MAG TPA: hypothetical protein VG894_01105 [Bauldia sp.]|nr:hypothetical protein [Bauldia sp.]
MERIQPYLPHIGVVAGSLIVGHLGLIFLPAEIGGFSTPILLTLGVGGAIAAALRWL